MAAHVEFPPLAQLRTRRSAKWTQYDADVLPMPVAEHAPQRQMDPVRRRRLADAGGGAGLPPGRANRAGADRRRATRRHRVPADGWRAWGCVHRLRSMGVGVGAEPATNDPRLGCQCRRHHRPEDAPVARRAGSHLISRLPAVPCLARPRRDAARRRTAARARTTVEARLSRSGADIRRRGPGLCPVPPTQSGGPSGSTC